MTDIDPVDENAIVLAFLQSFTADRAARTAPASLGHYQARFPGYEAVIAREYAALMREAGEPADAAARVASSHGSRYEPRGEVGRGGMGLVLRVWDQHLHRELAMKLLAMPDPAHARDPAALRRFLGEARITGQLAHPGIVPVHDMGLDGDGSAYFTMALIEGRDFGAIIESVHGGDAEWSLPRALGVILRVCEAVAFAHSRGVIHRDLKPGNVMVGMFGETYVVDWGLARVSDASPHAIGSEPGDLDARRTLAGDVIGTPAYMAPEQARGEVDAIGASADVYAIGAMLYHLLTRAMPYAGTSPKGATSREVLAAVREGPPVPIAAVRRNVAPELIAICERAMARRSQDRYPTVAALGDDLRAFLELRVVRAYETGAWAELRKWIRRNRALAATALFAGLALAGGFGYSLYQKARADGRAREADASFQVARNATERMLTRVARHRLAAVPQMESLRRDLLREALTMHEELLRNRRDDPTAQLDVARSHVHIARIHRALGAYAESRQAAEEAIARLTALAANDPGDVGARIGLADARDALGYVLLESGEVAAATAAFHAAIEDLSAAQQRRPDDPELMGRLATSLTNAATAASRDGGWAGTLGYRRKAFDLARQRMALQPGRDESHDLAASAAMNLGLTLANVDDLPGAAEHLRAALEYARPISPEHERDGRRRHLVGSAWVRLAMVQTRQEDHAAARASLEAAVDGLRELVRDFPKVIEYRRELGAGLNNLAGALGKVGEPAAQVETLGAAAKELEDAVALAPADTLSVQFLDETRRWRVQILLDAGRHTEAAQHIDAAARSTLAPLPPLDAARLRLRCADRAAADTSLSDAERAAAIEELRAAAVTSLAAVAPADPDPLDDDEFVSLRGRADYEALRGNRR